MVTAIYYIQLELFTEKYATHDHDQSIHMIMIQSFNAIQVYLVSIVNCDLKSKCIAF